MRCLVVLSGEICDDEAARLWLQTADRVICADGGARHLRRLGVRPDLLVGDLDSIAADDLSWIREQQVPVSRFPAMKNETDSELAIQAALADLPGPPEQHEGVILGVTGSRPDHVLANQLLAGRLAGEGWRLILTDGRSTTYTLAGGQTLNLDLPVQANPPWIVSAIPITDEIAGLTYQGLEYPLTDARLNRGSTRGLSNRPVSPAVRITLALGVLLIVVTPEE
ncbi:MAG TPA: thiamine diphosphokinase [Clostridiales bacterium]|nr:thiamine diphosphokinase [Clostridiales bacterium]